MVRLYARSLKGERAKGLKPTKRGKNQYSGQFLSSQSTIRQD
jgi:hypothetical protein